MNNRRQLLKLIAATPLLSALLPVANAFESNIILKRAIPSTGELLPAVGMGSYQTFNVSPNSSEKTNLANVLNAFFNAQGCLIDSSPMYGRSESVIGDLIRNLSSKPCYFAASKVWTFGKQAGLDAIVESQSRMSKSPMDLMQIHNLRDWEVHMPTLQQLKQDKKVRYTGITTSRLSQYEDFEQVMQTQELDFVQLNYNIRVRDAEKRLLPLAMDRGQAVIVNMPFEKGRLFKLVKGKSLPEWAKEIDCYSWSHFFLKFILSHPAVTCAIPATSKVKHMVDNMQAMQGEMPDKTMRQKMLEYIENL